MTKSITKLPINVALIFSIITLILFQFGPYDFPVRNSLILYVFLLCSYLAMYLGFSIGANSIINTSSQYRVVSIKKLMNILFIVALLLSIPKFIIYTGFYSGVFQNIQVSLGLFFSGQVQEVYNQKQQLVNAVGYWRYINYINILLSPLYWAYTPLAIYYWRKISLFCKIGTAFIWVLYILQYLCTGTNVGLFEFTVVFFIVSMLRSVHTSKKKPNVTKRHKVLPAIILILVLLSIFDYIMGSRIGDNTQYVVVGTESYPIREDSLIWNITPISLRPVLLYLTRYLAMPYCALDLSFSVPFSSTFGFGYSWFLLDNLGPYSNYLWDRTYMMQLEKLFNYDHWANWHTAYLWFANDVSHIGVPLILFFLCYIFGRAWRRFIITGDIISMLMFVQFINFTLFLSANNHVFQPSGHFLSFWLLLILGRFSNKFLWPNP